MKKAQATADKQRSSPESFKCETLRFEDVSEMSEMFRGRADVRFIQKAPGKVTATTRFTSIGPFQIQQVSWTGKLIVEAGTNDNMTSLVIPAPQKRPAFISGEYLNASDCMLYGASSSHFADISDRSGGMQLFLPIGTLEHAIAARLQDDPINLESTRRPLNPGFGSLQTLRNLVVELTNMMDIESKEEIETLCQQSLIKKVVDRISETLCRDRLLASGSHDEHAPSRCLLSEVRDIFEESGREPVYLYELCQQLGVSARTLQITFKQAYGISPMRYLKLRRLHAARERRFTTSVEDVSIKKAALENGFIDRSRFADDFKKLFGQLPSQTPRA